MKHMNLIAVGIACLVLFVGAFIGRKDLRKYSLKHPETQINSQEVLSTEDQVIVPTETISPTTVDNQYPTETFTPTPTSEFEMYP